MAISNWTPIGIALAATLVICGCARLLFGRSRSDPGPVQSLNA